MKITDFMVGDWVFVHKPTCKGHRVDYINEMNMEIGADGEIYDVCDIKPIPLTPEILENNGFKFKYDVFGVGNKDAWVWEWKNPGDKEYELPHGFYIMSHHNKKRHPHFWIYADNNPEIRYVHELQHVLRLCRIKKEIEL